MRCMHYYSERKNVFKECQDLVVLWLVSRNSLIVSDRVQKTPEGHMSLDGTTARRADDQRRGVDDVSVPSRRQEHRYRFKIRESRPNGTRKTMEEWICEKMSLNLE